MAVFAMKMQRQMRHACRAFLVVTLGARARAESATSTPFDGTEAPWARASRQLFLGATSPPPPSRCMDARVFASEDDGNDCDDDDVAPGSEFPMCTYCTDCVDYCPRVPRAPPPPPAGTPSGPGSPEYPNGQLGTDFADYGPGQPLPSPAASPAPLRAGTKTCFYDAEFDHGGSGSEFPMRANGNDCVDCDGRAASPPPPPYSPGMVCTNNCLHAGGSSCSVGGGPGSDFATYAHGTDLTSPLVHAARVPGPGLGPACLTVGPPSCQPVASAGLSVASAHGLDGGSILNLRQLVCWGCLMASLMARHHRFAKSPCPRPRPPREKHRALTLLAWCTMLPYTETSDVPGLYRGLQLAVPSHRRELQTVVSTVADLTSALANTAVGRIVLASGTYYLSAELSITRSVILEAAAGATVTLNAQASVSSRRRVLNINPGSSGVVQLIGLSITGGHINVRAHVQKGSCPRWGNC